MVYIDGHGKNHRKKLSTKLLKMPTPLLKTQRIELKPSDPQVQHITGLHSF